MSHNKPNPKLKKKGKEKETQDTTEKLNLTEDMINKANAWLDRMKLTVKRVPKPSSKQTQPPPSPWTEAPTLPSHPPKHTETPISSHRAKQTTDTSQPTTQTTDTSQPSMQTQDTVQPSVQTTDTSQPSIQSQDPPQSPKQTPSKYRKTCDRYKAALSSPKLDTSDFILNSLDLLKEVLADNPPSALKAISQQYQAQDYEGAIRGLTQVATENEEVLGSETVALLKSKSSGLRDDPMQNQSRRFYETRLAEHLEKDVKSSKTYLTSMDGLRSAIAGRLGGNLPKVTSPDGADKLLGMICRFNDNIEMELKKDSPKYQAKDRLEKPKPKDDERLSRNPGVMKANAPNFPDLVSDKDSKNRVPERNAIKEDMEGGYSKSNPEVPLVGSISGTTYTLVVLLQDYMKANAKDPNLQKGINDIVKAFVAFYIKNGFHSYSEMMDVLQEPNIQKVFAEANVAVDMRLPDEVLENADQEAQAYAKGVSLKGALHAELTSNPPDLKPVPEPKTPSPKEKTSNENLAQLLLRTGEFTTFEGRPGKCYLVFESAGEMQAAVERIDKELGTKAYRVAGNANTIEIHEPLQKLLGVKPQEPTTEPSPQPQPPKAKPQPETKPTVLALLQKGEVTTFKGKPGKYVVFKSQEDMDAAVQRIKEEHGDKAYRVSANANTIEIYDALQRLLQV